MGRSLHQCLADYSRVMLEGIAEGWHISLTDERLPEVVDVLAAEMTQPAALQRVWDRLSPQEKEALAFVASREQSRAFVITRKYGDVRRLGPGKLEWESAWREPRSPIEHLHFLGLVFRGYGVDGNYHGDVFFVPCDLRQLLPRFELPEVRFRVKPLAEPAVVLDQETSFARDVFVLLSHVRQNRVRARDKGLTDREVRQLHPRLCLPAEARRLELVQHLSLAGGLIEVRERTWTLGDAAADWLKDDSVRRMRYLFQSWMRDQQWNELCHVPSLRCEAAGWSNDPSAARKTVVKYLGQCDEDAWTDISSFIEAIREVDPDFARPDGDYDSWYIRDAETGQYLSGFHHWPMVEGSWLRYVLDHPLYWLGAIALGTHKAGQEACCFRVTELGAALLGRSETGDGLALASFVLEPSLHVHVPWEASWYDRLLLERMARWLSDDSEGSRYVIDGDSLEGMVAEGISASRVLAFLGRVSQAAVPKEEALRVQAWMRATGAKLETRSRT